MDKLADLLKTALGNLFPGIDVDVVNMPQQSREFRSVRLPARGGTAAELEATVLARAREFFGPGPELCAEDEWTAAASPAGMYSADITVHAHGRLAAPPAGGPSEADEPGETPAGADALIARLPDDEALQHGSETAGRHRVRMEPEAGKPMARPPWEANEHTG